MEEIYLDNAATTKVYPEVAAKMKEALLVNYGNPSSLHKKGLKAEKSVKKARNIIASNLGAKVSEIYFTSGGTEANNLAIKGSAKTLKRYGDEIITTKLAHPSLLKTCQSLSDEGFKIKYVPVNQAGRIDLAKLEELLNSKTVLVSLLAVNNELGTIQPLKKIAKLVKEYDKTYLHFDAVQAFGKLERLTLENIDLLSLSAHKIHGPKGIGALYCSESTRIAKLFSGSKQESGLRPGTENVPGIVGFAKAVELIERIEVGYLYELKNYMYNSLKANIADFKLNGQAIKDGAAHILNLSFKDIRGEVLVHALEGDGIYISTGAACSSKEKGSKVISNLSGAKFSSGTIRISFSWENTKEQIDYTVKKITENCTMLRKYSS